MKYCAAAKCLYEDQSASITRRKDHLGTLSAAIAAALSLSLEVRRKTPDERGKVVRAKPVVLEILPDGSEGKSVWAQ